jgi:hypothetical protein
MMWKEAVAACFEALSQKLLEGTEENHYKHHYLSGLRSEARTNQILSRRMLLARPIIWPSSSNRKTTF